MFCQKCGTQNSDDNKFCKQCGVELKSTTDLKSTVQAKKGSNLFTWKHVIVYSFFILVILSAFNNDKAPTPAQTASQTSKSPTIISSAFSDYGSLYCDKTATTLQKETLFDEKYKNKYVKWTGIVSSVAESFGSYKLQVKHCENTFVSDVIVTMKDDQKSKLMQLKEGATVTYIAKLTRYGELLAISADEGEIVT